jgi:hypothetical protein
MRIALISYVFFVLSASVVVNADEKSPHVAAKLPEDFKEGTPTSIEFHSKVERPLNQAVMSTNEKEAPSNHSVGLNASSGADKVAKSIVPHTLKKDSVVILHYNVLGDPNSYQRKFVVTPVSTSRNKSGFELELKEEGPLSPRVVTPTVVSSPGPQGTASHRFRNIEEVKQALRLPELHHSNYVAGQYDCSAFARKSLAYLRAWGVQARIITYWNVLGWNGAWVPYSGHARLHVWLNPNGQPEEIEPYWADGLQPPQNTVNTTAQYTSD